MSQFVVDASVAIKWLVSEDLSEKALVLLEPEHELMAPDFLTLEVANVLWKKVRTRELTHEESTHRWNALERMRVHRFPSSEFINLARLVAGPTGRTVYDSLYVALAKERNTRVVSADERFVNGLQNTPYATHIVSLRTLL